LGCNIVLKYFNRSKLASRGRGLNWNSSRFTTSEMTRGIGTTEAYNNYIQYSRARRSHKCVKWLNGPGGMPSVGSRCRLGRETSVHVRFFGRTESGVKSFGDEWTQLLPCSCICTTCIHRFGEILWSRWTGAVGLYRMYTMTCRGCCCSGVVPWNFS